MQETQVRSLGRKDLLEEGMATYSSILAWRIPRTEEPGGLQSLGLQRVGNDTVINTFKKLIASHSYVFLGFLHSGVEAHFGFGMGGKGMALGRPPCSSGRFPQRSRVSRGKEISLAEKGARGRYLPWLG